MLIKLLSAVDKKHLVELAKLLALSDKPLLWDGKISAEITSSTNLSALSIQMGGPERELIADLEKSADISKSPSMFPSQSLWRVHESLEVEALLIDAIKAFPIQKAERPELRAQAAVSVLKDLLRGKKFAKPSVSKIMLFELILVALRDGNISNIEWALLKEFQQHHCLEDFIFDDILKRAEALNQEISKTLSIVLE